ncbi:MAG: DNA repair protein RecO [Aeriscardovia sp.]|nr:DNA repair protein RecO [Aeriscardovia sp.]
MPLYSDEGLVLKTVKLGEADRIITILTAHHGKIRAVAKGIRRTRSRFGARLEPFMRNQLLIAHGRNLDVISQASCIGSYANNIITNYEAYITAEVICETADKLCTLEGIAQQDQYTLLLGAIIALAQKRYVTWQIRLSYILQAMALAGWRPQLDACVICGAHTQLNYFSVAHGGLLCQHDAVSGAYRVSGAQIGLLQALQHAPIKGYQGENDPQISRIVETWAQYYLERPIRSTQLVNFKYEF